MQHAWDVGEWHRLALNERDHRQDAVEERLDVRVGWTRRGGGARAGPSAKDLSVDTERHRVRMTIVALHANRERPVFGACGQLDRLLPVWKRAVAAAGE